MKNRGFTGTLFLILMLSSSFHLQAQEKKNLLKISFILPFNVSYERIISHEASIHLYTGSAYGSYNHSYFFLSPQIRYYLSENAVAPAGVFIAPYGFFSREFTGGGLSVGAQKLYKNKISLEAWLGPMLWKRGSVWGSVGMGFAF